MSNFVPFGKNTPPTSPGFPGGLRPPVDNGLNSWSGPTWRNPANFTQIKPPPTYPLSRLPPKLPPVPKGPGLGIFAGLKPSLPGLLLVGGLLLLDWWLSQPPSPPSTLPPVILFDKNLPIGQSFRVFYDAELFEGGRTPEGYFVCQGPFSDISEETVLPDRIWAYNIKFLQAQPWNKFAVVDWGISMANQAAYGDRKSVV